MSKVPLRGDPACIIKIKLLRGASRRSRCLGRVEQLQLRVLS